MKYLIAFWTMLCPAVLFAQVFNGNVTFETDAEIVAFGVENYQTINGNVTIYGEGISDLTPLASLLTINGDLQIGGVFFQNTNNLLSLNGLQNITNITGDLAIENLTGLSNFNGLTNLSTVGGNILLEDLTVNSLSGMTNLQTLIGDFIIEDLDLLTSLAGFPSQLVSIGGTLDLRGLNIINVGGIENINSLGSLSLFACHELISLQGFSNLTTINNNLHISGCFDLPNYNGLENINHIGENLSLNGSILIDNFSTFSGITSLGGILLIENHPLVTDLSDFSNLTSIGALILSSNDGLTNLTGLQNLTVTGWIQISFNDALVDLTGLSGITTFGGDFRVIENDGLTSLNGFPTTTTQLTGLRIDDNALLNDISALANVQRINGKLDITENAILTQLNGLEGVTYVDQEVFISENLKLENINGLTNLDSVGLNAEVIASGRLTIIDNPKLTSLPLWNNLTFVRDQIGIINNDKLVTISGINNLDNVKYLFIRDNANLTTITNFLNGLEEVEIDIEIKDNSKLVSLNGFQNLEEVGDDLMIDDNPLLNSLTGFEKLKDIGKSLFLRNISISNLDNFTLLENLQAISILSIGGLTNLNGLSNTTQLTQALNVTNNSSLSDCSGVCQHLDNGNIQINISGNLAPCDSPTNLEETCVPPPANDECIDAINLMVNPTNDCNADTQGTTFAATESLTGCNFEMDPIQDVWYSFTATQSTHKIKISNLTALTGNFGSVIIEIFSGDCNNLTSISQCQRFIDNESYPFSGLNANTTYYVRVYTDNFDGPADFTICVQTPIAPANDEPANAVILSQGEICNTIVTGTVEDATETAPNTQMCNGNFAPQAMDVWYQFTASTTSATFTVEPDQMILAPVIELFEGNPNTYVTCNYMNAPGTVELQMSNLNIGTIYYLRVFHGDIQLLNGSEATFNVCLHELPTIVLGQTFGNNCESSSVSYNSTGSGDWLHYDYFGQLIFSIQDTEPMGIITAEFYTNHNGIRSTASGIEVLDRNFEISPTNDPVNPIPVRFYLTVEEFNDFVAANDGDDNDVNDISEFIVRRYSGVDCANTPENGGVLHALTGWGNLGMNNYYLEVAFADFSSFFFSGGVSPLPVELINFSGNAQEDYVSLSWETREEINHSHFELQHSIDGNKFTSIGEIYPTTPTVAINQYSFDHYTPKNGINYYRLKQIDQDDQFEYSSTLAIDFDNRFSNSLNLYPNPANQEIYLSPPLEGRYSIINVLGKIIGQGDLTKSQSIDIHSLQAGRYYILVESEEKTRQYFSFVKI